MVKLPPPDSPLSAPGYSKAEPAISETRRRYKVSYVRASHINSKTCMTTYYSQHSSLYLKDDGLKEAGFKPGAA
jgi:toxic protein SymE